MPGSDPQSATSESLATRRLLLIRHAPVLSKGLCYGRLDLPCAEVDRELPELVSKLGTAIQQAGTFRLISSPAQRCQSLARRCADALGCSFEIENAIHELDQGEWEGQAYDDLLERDDFKAWMRSWQETRAPGGEGVMDLEGRVRTWLVNMRHDALVVAFAHAGVIRALRVITEGLSWSQAMESEVEHLRPYEFLIARRGSSLRTLAHGGSCFDSL